MRAPPCWPRCVRCLLRLLCLSLQYTMLAAVEASVPPASLHAWPALLPQALAGGSRITTLNLSSNNIGDAGAKALAEMLKVRAATASFQHTGALQLCSMGCLLVGHTRRAPLRNRALLASEFAWSILPVERP